MLFIIIHTLGNSFIWMKSKLTSTIPRIVFSEIFRNLDIRLNDWHRIDLPVCSLNASLGKLLCILITKGTRHTTRARYSIFQFYTFNLFFWLCSLAHFYFTFCVWNFTLSFLISCCSVTSAFKRKPPEQWRVRIFVHQRFRI